MLCTRPPVSTAAAVALAARNSPPVSYGTILLTRLIEHHLAHRRVGRKQSHSLVLRRIGTPHHSLRGGIGLSDSKN